MARVWRLMPGACALLRRVTASSQPILSFPPYSPLKHTCTHSRPSAARIFPLGHERPPHCPPLPRPSFGAFAPLSLSLSLFVCARSVAGEWARPRYVHAGSCVRRTCYLDGLRRLSPPIVLEARACPVAPSRRSALALLALVAPPSGHMIYRYHTYVRT